MFILRRSGLADPWPSIYLIHRILLMSSYEVVVCGEKERGEVYREGEEGRVGGGRGDEEREGGGSGKWEGERRERERKGREG